MKWTAILALLVLCANGYVLRKEGYVFEESELTTVDGVLTEEPTHLPGPIITHKPLVTDEQPESTIPVEQSTDRPKSTTSNDLITEQPKTNTTNQSTDQPQSTTVNVQPETTEQPELTTTNDLLGTTEQPELTTPNDLLGTTGQPESTTVNVQPETTEQSELTTVNDLLGTTGQPELTTVNDLPRTTEQLELTTTNVQPETTKQSELTTPNDLPETTEQLETTTNNEPKSTTDQSVTKKPQSTVQTTISPTLKTTERPLPTTTEDMSLKPCDGRLVVLLDTGKGLTPQQFTNQQQFFGQNLFSDPDNFNHFERLSVSQYGVFGAQLEEFGYFTSAEDVSSYTSRMVHSSKKNANLRRALSSIAESRINYKPTNQLTAAILVSSISYRDVENCRQIAAQIQKQNIRLVLIAHGSRSDPLLLAQITGDERLVYEWPAEAEEPANRQKLLQRLLACPSEIIRN